MKNLGMKNVVVLGSTGMLGRMALEVLEKNSADFKIAGLSGYKNKALLNKQNIKYKPTYGALTDPEEIKKIVCKKDVDIVVVTCGGVDLKDAVIAAVKAGKKIAMANKEMIVEYGQEIMTAVKKSGCMFIPVDSEHSGIFQCLRGKRMADIEKVYLTCSGGPFWNLPKKDFKKTTPEQALKHPVWKMGKKITVDSATQMNKALEIIEAKYLFDLRPRQIEVLIHPQSRLHAIVQFKDGNVLAHMGYPDMKIPLRYALYYPDVRGGNALKRLDLTDCRLEFFKPDLKRFPSIGFAYKALNKGVGACRKLNRINQSAVDKFLNKEIGFLDIFALIREKL
ncbi:1-deoxy-D-xylulose-5-phosphate reductoisomerase [Candidatus Peregrinibacteria bacterium]|nr:1-deoxy-D-xylulose-5-phosphate reductoisomerase [Candidatus Peregrinibacteria bacterium]